MKHNKSVVIVTLLVTVLAAFIYVTFLTPKPQVIELPVSETPVSENNNPIKEEAEIIVYEPQPNDVVSSPLVIKGKAKGTWYWEGEFPITLYYGVKDAFVTTSAFAIGEWMTEEYVDFEVILNFPVPETNEGVLVLNKSNPSDLREQDKSIRIPLRFHQ